MAHLKTELLKEIPEGYSAVTISKLSGLHRQTVYNAFRGKCKWETAVKIEIATRGSIKATDLCKGLRKYARKLVKL
jgi:hypothetical protein